MKLFPSSPPTPHVKPWQVPVSIVELSAEADDEWDLTLRRTLPHIDGTHSVARIASLADANLSLTCEAIRHLLSRHYVNLLDIFTFSATYVPTPRLRNFLLSTKLQQECALFAASNANAITSKTLIELYTSLNYGLTLKQWCFKNSNSLQNVDIRKLIVFGVIKGFLHRVRKYSVPKGRRGSDDSLSSMATFETRTQSIAIEDDPDSTEASDNTDVLVQFLDRLYSFDEICTNTELSEADVGEGLESRRDVEILQK